MTHDAYSTKRVTVWPEVRDGLPGFAIKYQDGYMSWCPEKVYERDYQPVEAMSFGHAIHAMKADHKVARAGWNGKSMWIAISGPTGAREVAFENLWSPHASEHARINGGSAKVLPCFIMKTATGEILMGWLASQTDMFADDWQIVT